MLALAILFGAVVGISLGLTGGGGGILAVPMLVYGVGLGAHQAVVVSLIAVAVTALFGAIERLRRREVDIATGLLFAGAGFVGAPLGAIISHALPPHVLLLMFSALMLYVAIRMWFKRTPRSTKSHLTDKFTLRRVMITALLGAMTGVLAGLFGVGGGFLIVPALVLVSGMPIHRAVATSLMVIPLMSVSGIATHLYREHENLAIDVTLAFVLGGVAGMGAGTWIGRRLSSAMLQKVFAVVIVAVAIFNVVMTLRKP